MDLLLCMQTDVTFITSKRDHAIEAHLRVNEFVSIYPILNLYRYPKNLTVQDSL